MILVGTIINLKIRGPAPLLLHEYVLERQGCEQVVPLEHLRSHAVKCEKNPNAEVVCDKGCNLKMLRHEYQSSDCFTHISSVLLQKDSEITRLSSLACRLEVENKQMNDELHQQKEENRQMNEAIYRLRSQINSSLLKWRRCENIKFSGETFNVMEIENKTRTVFAQYFYSLEPSFCFGVMILDWAVDSWMVIGLTRKHYPSYDPPGWSDESIGYNSYGCIQIDKTSAKVGDGWQNGDAVHCGIKFRQDTNDFLVMFLKNGKHVIEKCMQIPRDGLYPTICMWNTKIRYLNQ